MAIAIGNTTGFVDTTNQSAGSSTSNTITVGSGSTGLYVGLGIWNNGGVGAGASSVTFNGTNLSLVASSSASNGQFYTEIWWLASPTATTAFLTVTVGTKTDKLGVGVMSVTGGSTSAPTPGIGTGTSGTVTDSGVGGSTGQLMFDIVAHLSANNPTSSSGTSILNNAASGTSTASQYQAPVGSGQHMSYSYPDPGDAWAYSAIVVSAGSTALTVSVTDTSTLSESLGQTKVSNTSVADNTTTSDGPGYYSELVATREQVSVSVAAPGLNSPSVSDTITTAEIIAVKTSAVIINVSDTTAASETITPSVVFNVQVMPGIQMISGVKIVG